MADEEFHPFYKLDFLHSPCKWCLMHLSSSRCSHASVIPHCAGASWKLGFGLSAGRQHHLSQSNSHSESVPQPWLRDFYCYLVMLFPKNWHPSSGSLPLQYKGAQQSLRAHPVSHLLPPPQSLPGPGCAHHCVHCLCCTHCRSCGERGRGTWLDLAWAKEWEEAVWALSAHTWHRQTES